MNIKEKLFNIQQKLNAPKGQFNSFGNYNFRSCEDILLAVKPLLAEFKCILTLTDFLEAINNRYYVKAVATLSDVESDEKQESFAYAREEDVKKGMDGSQITGASSSYARKYALNGLFAIDDNKDSDVTNKHSKETFNCEKCGKQFKDMKTKSGYFTAKEIYEKSKIANGIALCKECIDKAE